MSLECLLDNLDNPINLRDPKRTNLTKLRYILIPLRDTSGNNNRFLNLLGLAYHTKERILWWILHRAAVYQDQICLVRTVHDIVPVVGKLPDHELTIWDVVGAAEGFYVDVMGSWNFLFCLDEEIHLCVIELLLFLLLVFEIIFLLYFLALLLFL